MVPDSNTFLNILFWNINGNLASKITDASFLDIIRKRDIVIIIESKLRRADHMDLSCFGFNVLYRSDRSSGSGGVAIAIRSWLQPYVHKEICESSKDLVFFNTLNRYVIGGMYIPPRESSRFSDFDRFQYMEDCLETIASKNLPFILVGDFNARFGNCIQKFYSPELDKFTEYTISNKDRTVNRSGRDFVSICNRAAVRILTGCAWKADFTCFRPNGFSVVDTGICSESMYKYISGGRIHTSTLSDHAPITFRVHIDKSKRPTPLVQTRSVVPVSVLRKLLSSPDRLHAFQNDLFNQPNILKLISDARKLYELDREIPKKEVSSFVAEMYNSISNTLPELLPVRKCHSKKVSSRTECPYKVVYSQECIDARRAFRKAHRIFKRDCSDQNYRILYIRRTRKRALERQCKRFAEKLFLKRILNQSDARLLWRHVRLKSHDTYNGPLDIEEYTSFLESIANGKYSFDSSLSDFSLKSMNSLCLMSTINNADLNHLLLEFPLDTVLFPKLRKAIGLDGWSGELIRCLYPILSHIIPYIFFVCIRSGVTPSQWDSDLKVPLPKPGKPLDKPNSLRPITLVNVIMKQYEEWLMSILNTHCQTSEHQAGFKKGYSCTGRLFLLRGMLESQLNNKKGVYAIFIDFSSFFDTVRGEILCSKLHERNVPEYLVRAIFGMLKDVEASVLMKGEMGRSFSCKVGLHQGSKSSPKLATLFLDEITHLLITCKGGLRLFSQTINHIFYADDLVLLFEQFHEASDSLAKLKTLCERFGLNVSVEKSFSVYFSKRANRNISALKWGEQELPVQSCAKYLGCTLARNLNFGLHVSAVEEKANRSFALLMNFQKRFPSMKFSSFMKLYFVLVFPAYAYSSEVFAWSDCDKLNSIFTEHLRRYLNLPKRTGRNAILYLTGTLPIHSKVYKAGYNFWQSVAKMDESRFEKLVYRTMKNSVGKNWFNEMCSELRRVGFDGDFKYWNFDYIRNEKCRFENTLHAHFTTELQNWMNRSGYDFLIDNVPTFGNVAHFLDASSLWDRRVLAKFILRGYKLESVTGTWHNLIKKERFCQFCWKNCGKFLLGDEIHYLEKCPRFQNARSKTGLIASDLNLVMFNRRLGDPPSTPLYHTLAKFIYTSFDQLPDPFTT